MASSESEPEFEITEILKQRKRKGLVEYLVRWNGYNDSDDDSWEPASSLTNCVDQLKKFAQAQELVKKEKRRLSRARSKSRGRSQSRARSKSASRKSEKKKSVSKSEKPVSNNVSKDEKSIPVLKSEGNSKVLSSDEEEDEQLSSTRSRQSTRFRQSTRSSQSTRSEIVTTSQVRSDIVDGSMTKITRLLGERREAVENHRNTDLKVTKSTSKSCFLADLWNNMDAAVIILFICITIIIFSFIMEKYISSDDISNSIAKMYKRSSKNIQNWWKILCAGIYNAWNAIVVFVQSNWKQASEK